MSEPGLEDQLGEVTWPPVRVRHHYAVSDALPLHRLGLMPPPPELGAHLLSASPIEAALIAAEATAELQAVPTALSLVEPDPSDEAGSVIATFQDSGSRQEAALTEAGTLNALNNSTMVDVASDGPLHIFTPDLTTVSGEMVAPGSWPREVVSDQAASGEATRLRAGEAAPGGMPDWTLTTEVNGDDPLQLRALAVTATLTTSAVGDAQAAAHGKLMRLDLSRRGDAPPGKEMPLPLLPDAESFTSSETHSYIQSTATQQVSNLSAAAIHSPTEASPHMSQVEPPAGNWPGFLTGLVMAVAIGFGLYVSLVGS